ncbi:S66 peptidase family protein [Desulfobulbus alkaliphilus]|uniref:S66 peptidase family protein n=1 Tax=Desulfobulbus alkaliphilus TaxID=869814 RepID=UPI001962A22E|nr:LD-carboxypeptidase [Desulfobulbus alkaliphilus]MBM9535789.1 LD-carboxypeptidase [Desulfobulbus alkaliphilus]
MSDQPYLPPALKPGDTIGVFCPAGPARDRQRLQEGIELIRAMGFTLKLSGPTECSTGYLAGTDEERAAHLVALWRDPEVKAILAVRGGFGCLRLLDRLDWSMFRRSPKFLAGFSDVTVLLNTLLHRGELVSIHSPVVTSLGRSDKASATSLFSLLTGTRMAEEIQPRGLEILRGGIGTGRLVGGNLTSLVHLLATPWDHTWEQCILLLEDTNEPLYRLDRMLTQLALAGRLERLAGLLLGTFDSGRDDSTGNLRLQEGVWDRVMELAKPGYPIWAGFPVGHRQRNIALPIGMKAVMDSAAGTLTFLPESVRTFS